MIAGYFNQTRPLPVAEPYTAMGWLKEEKVIGEAIFTGYTGSNIDIHINMPRCVCRKTIKDVYSYVFKQLKCNRLTARIEPTNDKLSRLLPRMGFVYEYTQEQYYGTPNAPVDALVYKLTKNNALKWIK